jgi:hypothetical protein
MYLKLRQTTGAKFAETEPAVFVEQLLVHLSAVCDDPTKGLTASKWLAKGRGNAPGTLRFLQETDLRQVRETALSLAEWVHSIDLFVGRHAVSVAIGLVLMAIEGTRRVKLPKVVDVADELAKANGVAAWTSMERYRETARALLDWSEHLPGIDLGVRTLTVDERTGWRNRAVCKRKEVASLVLDVLSQQATIRAQRQELGLEVGCAGGAVADRPSLTFAEFVKLEDEQEGAGGGVKDIDAWGAQAATGTDALPLPSWDDLADIGAPSIGQTCAIELSHAPDMSLSAQPAISTEGYSSEAYLAPALDAPVRPPTVDPGLDTLALPAPFGMSAELDPPTSPSLPHPELETVHFRSTAPSAFLPPPDDTFAHEGPFADSMTPYNSNAGTCEIDPSLLTDDPDPFDETPTYPSFASCSIAPPFSETSGQPSLGTDREFPHAGPSTSLDHTVPLSAQSVVAPESAPPLATPSFVLNHQSAKHLRPVTHVGSRPKLADRQRSLWLTQDVVSAVRQTGNDATALGKLLCAGLNVKDLPAHLAPTSTLGAVAALRQGGSFAIGDDELFADGERDAYVRPDSERDFLLRLWEKDGTGREMDEAAIKAISREEARRAKAARKHTRASAKSQSQYAGSRRTKAKKDLDGDAIALLLGESTGHAGPGAIVHDDDGSQAGGRLDALAEQYGDDADATVADEDRGREDDDSDEDDELRSSPPPGCGATGMKRARTVLQDEADLQTFITRARVLYDGAEGADDDDDGDEV